MSIFGIICETNPMHNGHKRLIDTARTMGAKKIVCVMSGNTTQRGEFAILDKYIRADALVKCGADLVVELPFPWCSGSAEYFSQAAVHILKNYCDKIIFGSECGDIELIKKAAQFASGANFEREYKEALKEGAAAAKEYFELLEKYCGRKFSSNDLLGIEYVKAAIRSSAKIDFTTIKRTGDGYNTENITDEEYPSATAIRKAWNEGKIEGMEKYIPREALEVYSVAINKGCLTDTRVLDAIYLSFFRLNNGELLEGFVGTNGGMANRICDAAQKAKSVNELINLAKNKRYTDANIRRTMIYSLVGVNQGDLSEMPKESLILSANKAGREIIAKSRKDESFKLVTKPADMDMSLQQNILTRRVDGIFTLANGNLSSAEYVKNKPYIEK